MDRGSESFALRRWLALCLALVGAAHLSNAALIKAKAWLAPVLISAAWEQTLASAMPGEKPWPWADTWPVARLRAPSVQLELLVLAGDSGNALAFGPGHMSMSSSPGDAGQIVLSGHRDTHFAFLEQLEPGQLLELQAADGTQRIYAVARADIVNSAKQRLTVDRAHDSLLLVTCYPFNALRAGGPLRYVVTAMPFDTASQSAEPLIGIPPVSHGEFDL